MTKLFAHGGFAASIVMIAFGSGSITGALGINTVRLSQEQIVMSVITPEPVDSDFTILVKGEPGDRW